MHRKMIFLLILAVLLCLICGCKERTANAPTEHATTTETPETTGNTDIRTTEKEPQFSETSEPADKHPENEGIEATNENVTEPSIEKTTEATESMTENTTAPVLPNDGEINLGENELPPV